MKSAIMRSWLETLPGGVVVDDDECTAVVKPGEAPPNLLFTPPCACSRCAPARHYEQSDDDGWLRIAGDQQRYRVEIVELGNRGREVL